MLKLKTSELIVALAHVVTTKGDLEMGLENADIRALESVGVKLPKKIEVPTPAPAPVEAPKKSRKKAEPKANCTAVAVAPVTGGVMITISGNGQVTPEVRNLLAQMGLRI